MKRKNIRNWLLGLVLVTVFLLGGAFLIVNEPLPEGKEGPKAEALAKKMLEAINKPAWDSLNWLQWSFAGRQDYVWDKSRNYAQIEWENTRVLMNLNKKSGIVWQNNQMLSGTEKDQIIEKAWGHWCNDSFWFNAPIKCYDPGTVRKFVELDDGREGLLITYETGGVTPGDSYLWLLDEKGLPVSWKMWVSIIPVGGAEFTWENWVELPGGALVAGLHKSKMINLEIPNIKGGYKFGELGLEKDPFAELLNK